MGQQNLQQNKHNEIWLGQRLTNGWYMPRVDVKDGLADKDLEIERCE